MHTTRKIERRLDTSGSLSCAEIDPSSGIPTAFRIWKQGPNETDFNTTIFSARSAKLLMADQADRGNRYAMDINHLSLDKTAPLENQRAVGFFSLEVRAGDLWAVDCEWVGPIRQELASGAWRYFSPAYDVDVDTGEVVSFLNCALTNAPATHGIAPITRIAASRGAAPRMASAASTIPTDLLRMLASSRDRDLARKARAELAKRGEQVTDPDTHEGRALAAMLPNTTAGIEHRQMRSEFGVMTQEQAKQHLEKTKNR